MEEKGLLKEVWLGVSCSDSGERIVIWLQERGSQDMKGREEQSDSGYILKIEPQRFRLGTECECERESQRWLQSFNLRD